MGYRIDYDNSPAKRKDSHGFSFRAMVAGCLLLLALLVRLCWPEGRKVMEHFLLPVSVNDMQTVLVSVAEDIRESESFPNVVAAFCREIIDAEANQ